MQKWYKKLVSFMLVISILISSFSISYAQSTDYQNHWASGIITEWIEKGLMEGYDENTFKPDSGITRAEFAALVNRAFDFEAISDSDFLDVSDDAWYKTDLEKAKAAGYLTGYEDNTIRPDNLITREEAACIIERLITVNAPEGFANLADFTDADKISDWSKEAASAVLEKGIILGYPDKTFQPEDKITRAEAIVLLDRALTVSSKIHTYKETGIFGPESGTETIDGDVVVAASETTLQNIDITGNLTIADTVGDGDVTLKNVSVQGEVYVKGGGPNSIHMQDCTIVTVYIEKDGVRVVAEGATTVQETRLSFGSILTEESLNGTGFNNVTVSRYAGSGIGVTLNGDFTNVVINSDNINLNVLSGSITKMEVAQDADGSAINLEDGVTVQTFNIDSPVAVKGKGQIIKAVTGVAGSTFETNPTNIEQTTNSPVSDTTVSGIGTDSGSESDAGNGTNPGGGTDAGDGTGPGSGTGSKNLPITFNGAYLNNGTSVDGNNSVPIKPTIQLTFDRGVTHDDSWEVNKNCITLVDSSNRSVSINVIRITDDDTERRHIYIEPKSNLINGASYKIILGADLRANNGNTLGTQVTVDFSVVGSSSSGGSSSGNNNTNEGSGSKDLEVSLQNVGTKIAGSSFNLLITGASNSNGDYLTGSDNVTVTSDLNGEVYNAATVFSGGDAMVTIPSGTVTQAGNHTLTVAISGVSEQPQIGVTVDAMTNINASNSTVTVDSELAKGATSTFTVTLKDTYGNPVSSSSKNLKIITTITGNDATTNEVYTITGSGISTETYTATATIAISAPLNNGEYQFCVAVPSTVDSGDGISIQVTQNNGTLLGSSFIYPPSVVVAPTVTGAITGTIIPSTVESEIVTGGKTIIVTLSNGTFATKIASDATKRANLFNSLKADGSETSEWKKVISALISAGTLAISRDSDTQLTITLPAVADYNISSNQTISLEITEIGIISGGILLTAAPTFTIQAE